MFNDYPCIIVASGNSVPFDNDLYKSTGMGLPKQLENIIKNNFSIGLNYFFQYGCKTNILSFVDGKFYIDNKAELSNIELIVGKDSKNLQTIIHPNTYLIPSSDYLFINDIWDIKSKICIQCKTKYSKDDNTKVCNACKQRLFHIGCYNGHLVSMFALTLAINLGFKEIYLLGYDCNEINGKTHFYQDLITDFKFFRGVGKQNNVYRTCTYNDVNKINTKWFAPYKDIKDVQIFNVSPNSVINVFPKITYKEFYDKVECLVLNHNQIKEELISYFNEKLK